MKQAVASTLPCPYCGSTNFRKQRRAGVEGDEWNQVLVRRKTCNDCGNTHETYELHAVSTGMGTTPSPSHSSPPSDSP